MISLSFPSTHKLKVRPRGRAGFTLPELLISAAVGSVVALVLLTFSSTSLNLFAKNYSLNESHTRSRDAMEKLDWLIHQAVEPPVLIDKNGAELAGQGPAAGVRCLYYASSELYRTSAALLPTSTVVVLKPLSATQWRPQIGDAMVLQYQDPSTTGAYSGTIVAPIKNVTVSGSTYTLTFAQALSTYFSPTSSALWNIAANQPLYILTYGQLVAVPSGSTQELRFYRKARSVATDGASVFNNPSNYSVLSELMPLTGQTECAPFTYPDAQHRRVLADLRSISRRYNNRVQAINYFESNHSAAAYRSAIQRLLQP